MHTYWNRKAEMLEAVVFYGFVNRGCNEKRRKETKIEIPPRLFYLSLHVSPASVQNPCSCSFTVIPPPSPLVRQPSIFSSFLFSISCFFSSKMSHTGSSYLFCSSFLLLVSGRKATPTRGLNLIDYGYLVHNIYADSPWGYHVVFTNLHRIPDSLVTEQPSNYKAVGWSFIFTKKQIFSNATHPDYFPILNTSLKTNTIRISVWQLKHPSDSLIYSSKLYLILHCIYNHAFLIIPSVHLQINQKYLTQI